VGIVRRWLRRFKFWLAVQGLSVLDPELFRSIRHAERQIRDANEIMRRRHGQTD
jgi:hypothetical protein